MLNILEASSVSIFSERSTQPGGPLRLSSSKSLGTTERVMCRAMYLTAGLVEGG